MKSVYMAVVLLLFTCLSHAADEDQWETYKGAWFSIKYPSDFSVRPSLKSKTSIKGYDSAYFLSPDGAVEFYIFSPQWNGEPTDIELNPKLEEIVSEKTDTKGDKTVRWYTIGAKDKSYLRSYVDTQDKLQNVRWVIGIKYSNMDVYNTYKERYQEFVKSLKQYAD
jgi:hypothetical protein